MSEKIKRHRWVRGAVTGEAICHRCGWVRYERVVGPRGGRNHAFKRPFPPPMRGIELADALPRCEP